jgi:hypothetical protein
VAFLAARRHDKFETFMPGSSLIVILYDPSRSSTYQVETRFVAPTMPFTETAEDLQMFRYLTKEI